MKQLMMLMLVPLFAVSCVSSGKYDAALGEIDRTNKLLTDEKDRGDKLSQENAELKKQIKKLKKEIDDLSKKFLDAMSFNDELKKKIKSMGASIDELESKRSEMSDEQKKLQRQLEELKKMKEAAEKRSEEFNKILSKLKKMIDSGTLSVKIRKGRMIVTLSSDILFPSGKTNLTEEGKTAIALLSGTLREIDDRNFLIIGHSDPTPIHTARFPSNWELSSQRAIEVVRIMIENGVKPEILTAAGSAEFDPVAANETQEGKAQNRRVEIVFLPKIDELPGFTDEKKPESESEE